MSHPKLFKVQTEIMPPRGLLKFRDLIAATLALKRSGSIGVQDAKITETATGVCIQTPINRAPGSTPFDAVAILTPTGVETVITPGFLFAGKSFIVPEFRGHSILSKDCRNITGAPKGIYIKTTWRPYIAPAFQYLFNTATSLTEKFSSPRFPQGVELVSCKVVTTDAASPEAAGWTDAGDNNQVPAIIRQATAGDGLSVSAAVTQNGISYERIAARDPDWEAFDPIGEIYPSSQAASGGGYGNRLAGFPGFLRTENPDASNADLFYTLPVTGFSIV